MDVSLLLDDIRLTNSKRKNNSTKTKRKKKRPATTTRFGLAEGPPQVAFTRKKEKREELTN